MDMVDFKIIKLVIWDLDDTLWTGTLSEGGVLSFENKDLIKVMADCGVVSSICSKNDYEPAREVLITNGVWDFFVFPSINWEPKGPRIKHMLSEMGLRAVNVLFVDDNIVNQKEAVFHNPGIMTASPEIIPELAAYFSSIIPSDTTHKRLKQYHVLEQKQNSKKEYSDNLDFLYSTNTKVEIHKDCIEKIDRIYELILRTNQLNYTKNRSSKEDLDSLLRDDEVDAGYVTVKDKFGDYGIVGFYALRKRELVHFLFSCRTIGQGVEQYVYSVLGCPKLSVVGDVINKVKEEGAPMWINQNIEDQHEQTCKGEQKVGGKIVMKGACDMDIMVSFLSSTNIVTEFTYIGAKRHNNIEHHNHSINYLQFPFLKKEERQKLLDECVFNDEDMFNTAMYDRNVKLLFLSTQIEPNLGIYRNKETGYEIAFGEYTNPLTDKAFWPKYIEKSIQCYANNFTIEWLQSFSEKWEYVGVMTVERYCTQLDKLLSLLAPDAKVCLLLGSEIPYEANENPAYEGREKYYQKMNSMLKTYVESQPRVYLLSFNDYIKGQEDFLDNINHYKRHVYYEASKRAIEIINECLGNDGVKSKGRISLLLDQIGYWGMNSKLRHTPIYGFMKKMYYILRK